MTKTIIASLLAVGFATSAFASDASEILHQDVNQQATYQHAPRAERGSDAYAYSPNAYRVGEASAEQREFDRVSIDTVSSR